MRWRFLTTALLMGLLLALDLSIPGVFLAIGLANLAVAIYITRLLPGALAKGFVAWLLQMLYRVEVTGLENLEKAGKRAVVVDAGVSQRQLCGFRTEIRSRLIIGGDMALAHTGAGIDPFVGGFDHLLELGVGALELGVDPPPLPLVRARLVARSLSPPSTVIAEPGPRRRWPRTGSRPACAPPGAPPRRCRWAT